MKKSLQFSLEFLFVFVSFLSFAKIEAKSWSIEEARRRVLENNHQVQASKYFLLGIEESKKQSFSAYLPKIELEARLIRSNANAFSGQSEQESSKLLLSQVLFSSPHFFAIKKSSLKLSMSEQKDIELKAQLLFELRQSYYLCLLHSEQVSVLLENVDILKDALAIEKAQEALGQSTDFEVEQAKLSLSNAQSMYFDAEKKYKISMYRLRKILNLSEEEELELTEKNIPMVENLKEKLLLLEDLEVKKNYQLFKPEEQKQWMRIAEKQNPLLKSLIVEGELAKVSLDEKRADYFPSVQAFASYETLRPQVPASAYYDHVNVGLRLSWTLFDSFARESRWRQANHGLMQQSQLIDQLSLDLQTSIKERLLEIEEAILSYRVAQDAVLLADSALEKGRQRLDLGSIKAISFRELLSLRKEAKLSLSQAAYHLLISYFSLQALVGETL